MIVKFFVFLLCLNLSWGYGDYFREREYLAAQDWQAVVGSSILLNPKEQEANDLIMKVKIDEYEAAFKTHTPQIHFIDAKPLIEKSKMFQILKRMPKGASLRIYDLGFTSAEFVFNLTYKDNVYGCYDADGNFILHFFFNGITDGRCNWKPLSMWRRDDVNFDYFLWTQISSGVENPYEAYPTEESARSKLAQILKCIRGLLLFKPVAEEYIYQGLKEHYDDNVKYLELRVLLDPMYDAYGNYYNEIEFVDLYYKVTEQFKRDHPDFYGMKLIYAPLVTRENADICSQTAAVLQEKYPSFFAGADATLLEQDIMYKDHLHNLIFMKNLGIKLFCTVGDTNVIGSIPDENLYDAILFNSTIRVGVGFSLIHHPYLVKIIKEKQIAIEYTTISNNIMRLSHDLRNQPGTIMLTEGWPMVIGSGHPGLWGAKGLSYDWFATFMGLTCEKSDLKMLKQLAINSITYSSLDFEQKRELMDAWSKSWNAFIDEVQNMKLIDERL